MMPELYVLEERLSDSLLGVHGPDGRVLMSARKLRKDTRCAVCRAPLKKGETAFGPEGRGANSLHRMDRVHGTCILP